jgi:hypothetical protein
MALPEVAHQADGRFAGGTSHASGHAPALSGASKRNGGCHAAPAATRTELLDQRPRTVFVAEGRDLVRGPEPLEAGALVAGILAELRSRTVAGVRVYVLRHDPVRRDAADRGWAPAATSIHLDRVALA